MKFTLVPHELHYTYIFNLVAPTSTSVSPKPGGAWITPGHSPYIPQQQLNANSGKNTKQRRFDKIVKVIIPLKISF